VDVKKVYHCPHHPEISGECSCRKPHAGMLLEAQKEFNIDLKNSILVGDKERDIEAGLKAGLQESYLFDQFNKSRFSKATRIVSKFEQIWNK
jgi:D-glycero-D-manno-heptose 1,7-bisphosphate phosphatase